METIIAQILPIVITAIGGVLVVIIKSVGDAVVSYVKAKKEEVVVKIGIDKYNQQLAFGKSIWSVVEEHFRVNEIVGDIVARKQELFDKLLKEKIPTLTDEQIVLLRQQIAGSINATKTIVVTPAVVVVDKVASPVVTEATPLPVESVVTTVVE